MQRVATNDVSNRQTLATLYQAFAQGDVETVKSTLTDDIEWHVNGPLRLPAPTVARRPCCLLPADDDAVRGHAAGRCRRNTR